MLITSPLDPAYPASRQIAYLRVAAPRGLVVLKGAGTISPSVREFLSEELNIRVEVPALEVFPDGTIVGGVNYKSDEDVLKPQAHLGWTDPNVALGPDSIGTLSFTSGSTGIPKGVKGRHFSLTHFFPWMGEHFGLNGDSKFTMLSGIAHDPIQRDSQFFFPPSRVHAYEFPVYLLLSVYTSFLWCTTSCPNSRGYRYPRSFG